MRSRGENYMQPTVPAPKIYQAKRLQQGHSISLGGQGQDDTWRLADVLTDFAFPWNARAPPATEFRALWDALKFYFRFDVTDSDVVLGDGANAMQKVIGSDRAEIFFSAGVELDPYYALEIDPRGEVLDYEARFYRQMNRQWTCEGLEVASRITGEGYVVEGQLPLATFRRLGCLHQDATGEHLIAGLYRAEFSSPTQAGEPVIEDWMSWVDPQVATPDFHVPTSFGMIRFSP